MKADQKTYELGYLLSPLVAADQVAATIETEVKHWLTKAGAELKREVLPHSRALAYPIKKVVEHKGSIFREAYFGAIYFTCAPESLSIIETGLKKSSLLVRHLLMVVRPEAALPPVRPEPTTGPELETTGPVAPSEAPKMTETAIDQEIDRLLTPTT